MEPSRSSSFRRVSVGPSVRATSSKRLAVPLAGAAGLTGMVMPYSPPVAGAASPPERVVFVANYGGMGSSGVAATGSVTSYRVGGGGDVRPLATISAGVNAPQGLAFDGSGNLWVSDSNTNTVVEFTKAALAQHLPNPSVTISAGRSEDLNGPAAWPSTGPATCGWPIPVSPLWSSTPKPN